MGMLVYDKVREKDGHPELQYGSQPRAKPGKARSVDALRRDSPANNTEELKSLMLDRRVWRAATQELVLAGLRSHIALCKCNKLLLNIHMLQYMI